MPARTRRVALIYDAKFPYDLKVISGIARYVQEGAELNIYIEEDALKSQRLPDLRSWHGDGILADFDDPGVAAAVSRARLPVVGFGGGYGWYSRQSAIPYFFSNQTAVANLAADHLIERGFQHFAYCGLPPPPQIYGAQNAAKPLSNGSAPVDFPATSIPSYTKPRVSGLPCSRLSARG